MSEHETTGLDSQAKFRCTSDFMPLVHLAARSQGLTASSFIRYVLHQELRRLGVSYEKI